MTHAATPSRSGPWLITLAALGVVFGDIGTSPLYAFKLVFVNDLHALPLSHDNVLGVLSLFFWSLLMVVTVKYVFFIMRVSNNGEGGLIALLALLLEKLPPGSRWPLVLTPLGLLGAAFFYGDGLITPAISVLSAVEGLELISPHLADWVIPVALAILVVLFLVQSQGTSRIGFLFGPIMLVWFLLLAVLGVVHIAQEPAVLKALNPLVAVAFAAEHGALSFFALGSVVLCITGAEALYADMGHFGRPPIQRAWLYAVFPALVLNYFGQGALVLHTPSAIQNPFFLMAPDWGLHTLVVLSTVATVIASQAVISGTFSVTQQLIHLRYLPRMTLRYTSTESAGQIYIPAVNWTLLFLIVLVVITFKSSDALGTAYGIAVTGTMLITDIFAIAVAVTLWRWSMARALLGAAGFLLIDSIFFSANALKLFDGGWFPVALSVLMLIILGTWRRGTQRLAMLESGQSAPLTAFMTQVIQADRPRMPGWGVYLVSNPQQTPASLQLTWNHFQSVHEHVALLHIVITGGPYATAQERMQIERFGHGFSLTTLRYGYKEDIDIPAVISNLLSPQQQAHLQTATFFLARGSLSLSPDPCMPQWQKKLFMAMYRNASPAFKAFRMPANQVVELSAQVAL